MNWTRMTNRYVLDSWAWLEYFEGHSRGERVRKIISDERDEIFTHAVTVAEIISKAVRSGKDVEAVLLAIRGNSNIVPADVLESKEVGITHAITKKKSKNFSLADAFVLATARKMKANIVTGDPDFRDINGVIML